MSRSPRWPDSWPAEATTIADATVRGVGALVDQDPDAVDEAVGMALDVPQSRVDIVHAAVVRDLLEQTYPAEVTGVDLRTVVQTAVVAHGGWLPELDLSVLVTVLLGALGMDSAPAATDSQDPDDVPEPVRPPRAALVRHGFLAIAALCALADSDEIASVRAAVDEIQRAETIEMP